ncbi:MAG: winged helix-turn-helix transcriptional regulator [Legionellales bacterium]|nr:winged helix-turn-helix transcriptional regulator [Legionellales bacterium]
MDNPPFRFHVPEDSPGFLLWQTTMSWQRLIKKKLEPYNISHSQFVILAILLWYKGKQIYVPQNNIIKMSKLDKMTISKSLRSLVSLGYVTREENIKDTRE